MRAALLSLPFLLLAVPATAQDLEQCDGPNVVMTKCIWDAYEAADAELNDVWGEVLATIKPEEGYMPEEAAKEWKDHLVAAQRAWVTFKEEDCNGAVAYEWYQGTGANAAIGTCLFQHTVARTQDLRDRYLANR
jgi:uncharacterized protein YecT (DUF1311 family)